MTPVEYLESFAILGWLAVYCSIAVLQIWRRHRVVPSVWCVINASWKAFRVVSNIMLLSSYTARNEVLAFIATIFCLIINGSIIFACDQVRTTDPKRALRLASNFCDLYGSLGCG